MAYVMILAGGGMVVGNLAGGFLSDKLGPEKNMCSIAVFNDVLFVRSVFPFRISKCFFGFNFHLWCSVDVGCGAN